MTTTLLSGAQVITMAPNRPAVERLDLLIDDDRIIDLGTDLHRPGAEIVEMPGRVIIPGLVNAHLHTWQTALRCLGVDWTLLGYLTRLHGGLAQRYRPQDMHISTLAGALGQINAGTTTIGDWCHNCHTPEHADAALDGLIDSGVRAVYLHGTPYRPPEVPHPLGDVDRLIAASARAGGLVGVGMAVQGPQLTTPEVALADFRAALERDVLVSMHQSGGDPEPGWEALRAAGLFGPHANIVHGVGLPEDWLTMLVDAGVSFTATPEVELGMGHGTPITGRLLRLGSAPSLGTDVESVAPGGMLTAARIALAHQRGLDHAEHHTSPGAPPALPSITAKQALKWATVDGARALGLADRVGHLAPGMQADLVAIDTRSVNLWPAHDPVGAVLYADTADIEAVMIAGQWRKREHRLLAADLDAVQDRLSESGRRLLEESDSPA